VKSGLSPEATGARRLGEHLFRLAGRLRGPAAASEARRLAAILRIVDEVPKAHSAEQALRVAVTGLRDGIEFDGATGFLFEPAENRLVPTVVVGSHVDLIPDFSFDHGVGLSSWVVKTRRPVLLAALRRDAEMPDTDRPSSFLSVPFIEGDKVIGVLNLAHRRAGAFASADRDFVLLASRFVVPTLRERRAAEVSSVAHTESVDPLVSRRQLEMRLQEAERACRRGQKSFAVVGLCFQDVPPGTAEGGTPADLGLGHAVDGYLNRLSANGQFACRLGPDTVAILLPHVTSQEAWRVATELRQHVLAECLPPGDGRSLQIASVIYPHDAGSAPELIARMESILGAGGEPTPAPASRVACA
jgi:GGDEF domain-containing protein